MLGKPHNEPSDPADPSPGTLEEVDGVVDWHNGSPLAQFELVDPCCCVLPGIISVGSVCALAAATVRATKKTINIRKHLLELLLILVVFRLKNASRITTHRAVMRDCLTDAVKKIGY